MSIHVRAKIRHAVTTMLTGLPTTNARVFPSRVFSLAEDELPSLSVYALGTDAEEEVTRVTLGSPALIQRAVPVVIEGHVAVDDDVDDVMDRVALEVEAAMSAELKIDGVFIPMQLQSTSMDLLDGELLVGVVRLTYMASYACLESRPDVIG